MENIYDISNLSMHFPILKKLREVPQEAQFHAEGDVLTHTMMVLQELFKLDEWPLLSDNERKLLYLAAAFHDIGKIFCTKTLDGKIVSPRHAINGSKEFRIYAWKELFGLLSFDERETIVNLIRYHGLPIWFFEKREPKKELIKASLGTPIHLLYLLSKADAIGRICDDKQELLYNIELFKEFAIETKCFNNPFFFDNCHHKYHYLSEDDKAVEYIPFNKPQFEVVLMSGLPGSGKDYYIKENLMSLPEISLDKIRLSLKIKPTDNQGKVVSFAKNQSKEFLRTKQSFVWNATNISTKMRTQLIDLFTTYNASIKVIYIEVTYEQLLLQNNNREHPIPEKALYKLISKLEVPQLFEAHKVEYIVNGALA